MRALRAILIGRWRIAMLLVAVALSMKALVPGGFMVTAQNQTLTISICGDASGEHLTRQIVVPQRETSQDRATQHAKTMACPFSALDMAGTPGADPFLLALALAFILAIGLAPLVSPILSARAYLRPPLRGPPSVA